MKINIIPTIKLAILCTAVCAAMLAFTHNASALTIGDGQTIGYVYYGIPSGDADRENYVNDLVGFYNSGCASGTDCGTAHGQLYHMVNGSPAFGVTLPHAIWAADGTSTTINLGTLGTYNYLFAKYDGPNQGSVVWYVGNLSGSITIPATWNQYGLSGWSLFGPGGAGVPDGGTTVMLLGAALGALGMARRYLRS
jgi:hypothetical protein